MVEVAGDERAQYLELLFYGCIYLTTAILIHCLLASYLGSYTALIE